MSTKLFDLTGKTALITGASQGIGYTLAEGLGAAGAQIVLNGRSEAKVVKAAEALGVSSRTVKRRWKITVAWIREHHAKGQPGHDGA